MSEKPEKKDEIIKIEKIEIQKKASEIYDKGLKAWYKYERCLHPTNAEEAFYLLQDCIEDGKELLFKELKDYKDEQLNKVFTNAEEKLKIKPDNITESVGYKEIGDDKIPIIIFKADDAGESECFREDKDKTRRDFERQQFKFHIPKLMEAHNKILHQLVKHDIIPIENKSLKELREERKKHRFKQRKETA